MFSYSEKLNILKSTIEAIEDATGFSSEEYIKGRQSENIDSLELARETIQEFEYNSDQNAKTFLLGEGYSEEEIEEILFH